jgi:hypothetical protein
MREPTLPSFLDKSTVPPGTFRILGGMSLDDYILDETQIDITLTIVWEECSDSES